MPKVDQITATAVMAVAAAADELYGCIRPSLLSTCPLDANNGCGNEGRILFGPWRPAKVALVRKYLEVYWPCAGGLSAVNAIGTQLCDPINTGLARWRMAV